MPKTMSHEEKLTYMTQTSLPRLIFSLSVPTIISMLITAFYNMADTYFVGLIGSASATGAIGVVFPLMSIMQAVAFMFGHGSGNHMSRSLGAGDTEDAEKMAATGFFSAFVMGCLIMLIGLCIPSGLVSLLGATDTIAPYATQYVLYLMPGAPFLISSFVLNNQLRFQGSAFYGMIGMTAGTLLNVVLDPVFIFVLDMGVAGAALATSLGQVASFVLLLLGTRRGCNIRIRFRSFTPTAENFREIFRGGVPSLARQGLASLATICLNIAAAVYGDAAVAAMSIVNRVMQMCGSAVIGFGQGFQPVCGFNYGAKLYGRVRDAFWFSVKICFLLLIVVAAAALCFAPQIVALFLQNNAEVQQIGALALRLQCVTLPLFSFVIISNMMLQTIGMAGKATLLAASRQGLFLIPAVFLLPKFFGLLGVQMSQTVSDVLSFLLAVPLTLKVLKSFTQQEETDAVKK
ncbi:MAG: MATE family efflux transporter [Eubacteriales bacterium]|nr:MATE family efflux transporter [Eubacteriales bacterium]